MRSNYARPETLAMHHANYRLSTFAGSQVMIRLQGDDNLARILGSPRLCRLEVRKQKQPIGTMTGFGTWLKSTYVVTDETRVAIGTIERSDVLFVGSRFRVSLPEMGPPARLQHRDLGLKGLRKKYRQKVGRHLELVREGTPILSVIDHHTMVSRGCLVQFHDEKGPALDRRLGLFLAYLILMTPNILSLESVEHLDV